MPFLAVGGLVVLSFTALGQSSPDYPIRAISPSAVKIDDGAHRARTPVTVATLRLLGAAVPAELATAPVIGGEVEVGVIRAAEGLAHQS